MAGDNFSKDVGAGTGCKVRCKVVRRDFELVAGRSSGVDVTTRESGVVVKKKISGNFGVLVRIRKFWRKTKVRAFPLFSSRTVKRRSALQLFAN